MSYKGPVATPHEDRVTILTSRVRNDATVKKTEHPMELYRKRIGKSETFLIVKYVIDETPAKRDSRAD